MMYQILPHEKGDLLAIRVVGMLKEDDHENLGPLVQHRVDEYGQIDLFWEMDEGFVGWAEGGAWENFKFGAGHPSAFRKIAVVADEKWHPWMARAMDGLSDVEVEFFTLRHREAALAWIKA
ncbi:hypothetical protein BH23VER1_BH23VER1_31090 [soil metagenome]